MPSASGLLDRVQGSTLNDIIRQGVRGGILGVFMFLLAIVSGFVRIAQGYFDALAGAVGNIYGALYNGIAGLISTGFGLTMQNFLNLGPFGFAEGLVYAGVAVYLVMQGMEFFGTDIFFIPGFDWIPFIGNEADGDEES